MKPLPIDVVIPVHNAAAWVGGALDSLLEQNEVLGQIIVVDNNSSDDSMLAVQRWASNHPDIPLIATKETTPGACAARNKGLEHVETEWVQFLDADDVLLPGKMALQAALTAAADVVFGEFWFEREGRRSEGWGMEDHVDVGLAHGRLGNTCCNLFRTAAVVEVGGWDENLPSAQEYDLMFRLRQKGKRFQKSSDRLTVVRLFPEGRISTGNESRRRLQSFDLRLRMLSWMLSDSSPTLDSGAQQRILNALFNVTRWLEPWQPEEAAKGYKTLQKFNHRPSVDIQLPLWFVSLARLIGAKHAARLRHRILNTILKP